MIQCGSITIPFSNATNLSGNYSDHYAIGCEDGYETSEGGAAYRVTCEAYVDIPQSVIDSNNVTQDVSKGGYWSGVEMCTGESLKVTGLSWLYSLFPNFQLL